MTLAPLPRRGLGPPPPSVLSDEQKACMAAAHGHALERRRDGYAAPPYARVFKIGTVENLVRRGLLDFDDFCVWPTREAFEEKAS